MVIWLKLGMIIIGSLVGAGFASGQEIMLFFNRYGEKGFLGIVLTGGLLSFFSWGTLKVSHNLKLKNYRELIELSLSSRYQFLADFAFTAVLFGGLGVMLSASGAIFHEYFNLPGLFGIGFLLLIVLLTGQKQLLGLYYINIILTPLLVIFLIVISCKELSAFKYVAAENHWLQNWLSAAIIYASYNILLLGSVLVPLGREMKAADIIGGVIFGTILFWLLAGLIYFALAANYPDVLKYQVPLLYLAGKKHFVSYWLFGICIWLAVATTAVSDGVALALRLPKSRRLLFFVYFLSFLVALIPFQYLVKYLYPLFGYAGFLFLYCLLKLLIGIKW
ncbi:YkvI family membrane protein [Carboxydothermus hydrogenoformans]|nr:hypothetical protein [Carboxydothermus hydrogenoformans]